MDVKIPALVFSFSLLLLAASLFLLPTPDELEQTLPWQIQVYADGSSQIFGLHLGRSKLSKAEHILQGNASLSLFYSKQKHLSLEAYFDKIELGGLSAKMVLVLDVPNEVLHKFYARGSRISSLSGGGKKISLSSQDRKHIEQYSIISITYLPKIKLQADQLLKRFGNPQQQLTENGGKTHWLYPKIGLDAILSDDGNDVLQYVRPQDFQKLMQPLKNQ